MKFLMKPNVLMILLLAVVFQVRAEVKMPALFANNAILQQKSEVAMWGWADAKATVRITSYNVCYTKLLRGGSYG